MDPMDLREVRDPRPEDEANQAVVEIACVTERSMVLRSNSGNEEVQACDTPLRPLWEIRGSLVKHTPEQIAEFRKMRDPEYFRELRRKKEESMAKLNQAVVEIACVTERNMVLRSSSGNEEVQACDTPLRPLWEIRGSLVKHTPEQIAEFRKMRDPEYFRELRRKKEESMAKLNQAVVEIACVTERNMVLRSSSGNEEVQACDTPLRPLWEIRGSLVKHTPEQIAEFRKMRDPEYFRELRRKKEESMAKLKEDVSKDLDLVEAPPPSQSPLSILREDLDSGFVEEELEMEYPARFQSIATPSIIIPLKPFGLGMPITGTDGTVEISDDMFYRAGEDDILDPLELTKDESEDQELAPLLEKFIGSIKPHKYSPETLERWETQVKRLKLEEDSDRCNRLEQLEWKMKRIEEIFAGRGISIEEFLQQPLAVKGQGSNSNSKMDLIVQHEVDPDIDLTCLCGLVFSSTEVLEAHVKSFQPAYFPCPHCGRKFHREDQLELHLKVVPVPRSSVGTHRYIIPRCISKTINKSTSGRKSWGCAFCLMTFSTLAKLNQHRSSEHAVAIADKYGCLFCTKLFTDQEAYKEHIKIHFPEKSTVHKKTSEKKTTRTKKRPDKKTSRKKMTEDCDSDD